MHQISTVENPAIRKEEEEGEYKSESSKDRWYEDYDQLSEPPDAGEMVDDQSDISDFEETYIKKKKKKVHEKSSRWYKVKAVTIHLVRSLTVLHIGLNLQVFIGLSVI